MKAPFRRSALYASLFVLGAQVAGAQQLEEIIVTAQKRAENLQDVPVSVNAVSGTKMEEFGITNLEKLTAYVQQESYFNKSQGESVKRCGKDMMRMPPWDRRNKVLLLPS